MAKRARLALLASPTEQAQAAAAVLSKTAEWVPLDEAETVVVLGGDGFMLQTLHHMLDDGPLIPAYGLNLGTVGFLMNKHRSSREIGERVARARRIDVAPLAMVATTNRVRNTGFAPSTRYRCCAKPGRPPRSR